MMGEDHEERRLRLYTIGHSNRDIDDFMSILAAYGVQTIVDIRSYPHSSRYAQHDRDALEIMLQRHDMTYHWFPDLGGWQKGLGEHSPNKGLHEGGYRNYADYMLTDEFHTAAGRLQGIARIRTTTVMCAEKDMTRCHRQYLSDYLVLHDADVYHIVDDQQCFQHHLSKHAAVTDDHKLVYPPHNPPGQNLLFET